MLTWFRRFVEILASDVTKVISDFCSQLRTATERNCTRICFFEERSCCGERINPYLLSCDGTKIVDSQVRDSTNSLYAGLSPEDVVQTEYADFLATDFEGKERFEGLVRVSGPVRSEPHQLNPLNGYAARFTRISCDRKYVSSRRGPVQLRIIWPEAGELWITKGTQRFRSVIGGLFPAFGSRQCLAGNFLDVNGEAMLFVESVDSCSVNPNGSFGKSERFIRSSDQPEFESDDQTWSPDQILVWATAALSRRLAFR
jgi:hypothetical protein